MILHWVLNGVECGKGISKGSQWNDSVKTLQQSVSSSIHEEETLRAASGWTAAITEFRAQWQWQQDPAGTNKLFWEFENSLHSWTGSNNRPPFWKYTHRQSWKLKLSIDQRFRLTPLLYYASIHLQSREGDCPSNVTRISHKQIHGNLPQDDERPPQMISRNWWETCCEWLSKAFELIGCHSKCFLLYVITSLRVLQFIEGLIKWQPDILVSEIAEYLWYICHIDASPPTILRTLHRCGFTRKMVLFIQTNNQRIYSQAFPDDTTSNWTRWVRLCGIQDAYRCTLPAWTPGFCRWKPLQLSLIVQKLCLGPSRWACGN